MGAKTANEEERDAVAQQISQVLRDVRAQRHLSQEDVAERIGVAAEIYGRMERGLFVPRVRTIVKLARALSVSVDSLLGLSADNVELTTEPHPEDSLPSEARRLLRIVRELQPEQMRMLAKAGVALISAKAKRGQARADKRRR